MKATTLAVGVALLLVLAAPQHYRDDIHTANESARVYAALALVKHHTVALDPVFDDYFPGWRERGRPPNMDVSFRNGHYLLDKAPGLTLLALPVVAALEAAGVHPSYAHLTWWLTLLFAAVPTVALVLLARRWTDSPVPLVVVLASPWLVYGGLFFGHALAAALVAGGAVLALGSLAAERDDARGAFGGGLALGAAVLVEYTSALVVVLVLVALVVDPRRRTRLLHVCAGGLGPALVLLAWNTLVFGGPLAMSYAFKANRELAAVHGHGLYGLATPGPAALWGLLFGASRGLFFVAPWLLLGLVGALAAAADARLARAWRVTLAGGALLLPCALAGFHDWQGGLAFGPRYLLIAVPLLGIGVVRALERMTDAAWASFARWALAGLMVSSFLVCATGAYVYPYLSEQLVNPIFEVDVPVLLAAGPAPTILGRGFVGALVAAGLGLGLVVWSLRGWLGRARPVLVAIAVAAAVGHILVAIVPESPSAREVWRERARAHQLLGQDAAARRASDEATRP